MTKEADAAAPWPLEDLAENIRKACEEAHAAGAGSDPEARPEPPSDADAEAPPALSARLMGEALKRHADAMTELAEYRRNRRTQ